MELEKDQIDVVLTVMADWTRECLRQGMIPGMMVAMRHGQLGEVPAMLCVGKSFSARDLRETLRKAIENIHDDFDDALPVKNSEHGK
jgi:hypothetical protein